MKFKLGFSLHRETKSDENPSSIRIRIFGVGSLRTMRPSLVRCFMFVSRMRASLFCLKKIRKPRFPFLSSFCRIPMGTIGWGDSNGLFSKGKFTFPFDLFIEFWPLKKLGFLLTETLKDVDSVDVGLDAFDCE